MRALLTFLFVLTAASPALADETDDRYTAYYGDGIRAYTESRYDDALTHLYRALATKPNPLVLKLIIRSHDFQGNCSARANAATIMNDMFPGESAPPTQRCTHVGELRIECSPDDGPVRVDKAFEAPCGAPLLVPSGEHEVEIRSSGVVVQVTVQTQETTTANFARRPGKWYLDARHQRVVELPRRWLRPALLTDPDMPRSFEWKRPGPTRR